MRRNLGGVFLLGLLASCSDDSGGAFTAQEWEDISSLAGLPDPAPDPSNRYVGVAAAEAQPDAAEPQP